MLHAGGKLLNKSCVQSNALPCLSARHRRAVRAKASSDAGTGIKGPAPLPDPVLGDMRIILVSPKTPGNIGSVCRVAACFEAPQVYVVAPRCDPFSEEAKMMASSCPQLLQGITVVPSLEVALADTQDTRNAWPTPREVHIKDSMLTGAAKPGRAVSSHNCFEGVPEMKREKKCRGKEASSSLPGNFFLLRLPPQAGSIGFTRRAGATRVTHKSLLDLLRTDPQAIPCMVLPKQSDQAAGFPLPQPPLGVTGLVFGREESGLSEAEMHLCTHACAIPTGRLQGSMNLSHAVAVVQAELFQRRLLFLEQAGAPGGQQGVAGQTMSPGGQDPLLMGTSVSGPADVTSASPQQPWPMEQQGHEAGPPQARPATAGEVEALLKKVVLMAKAVGASTEESTGGGSQGSHGRRRKPVGHMRSIFSKARLTQAEVRALHGFASQVLERLDGSSRGKV